MSQQALTIVGYAVGTYFGNPQLGALIGSVVGGVLFPEKISNVGPRINDLTMQASQYGQMVPVLYGARRIAGNVIFATDKREVSTSTRDGKGGPQVTNTTYSYNCDMAIALCDVEIAGICKVWSNGKLVYDASSDADVGTVLASRIGAEGFTVYFGTEDQEPDPTIEATVGAGLTPAYRGVAYVVFDRLDLPNGQIPQLHFEVATIAAADTPSQAFASGIPNVSGTLATVVGERIWQFHGDVSDIYRIGPGYYELAGRIDFTNPGFDFSPVPCQGGAKAIAGYVGADYSVPMGIVVYDLETGERNEILSYIPGTESNRLLPQYAAYDPITGYYCAINANTSHTRGQRITILPSNVMTSPTLDTPARPMAFYDGVIYIVGTHAGTSYLQSWDGETGVIIGEISAEADLSGLNPFVYAGENGIYVVENVAGGIAVPRTVWKVTDVWTVITTGATYDNINGSVRTFYSTDTYGIFGHLGNPLSATTSHAIVNYAAIDPEEVALADIIEDICVRSGLDASQVDCTGVDDTVHGYALTNVSSARVNLEPLMRAYSLDAVESDGVLKFRKRADQTSVATITFDELGAADGMGGSAGDAAPLTRTQEAELPRSVTVNYYNVTADYQAGTEGERRQVTESIHDVTLDVPIAMQPDDAAAVAARTLYEAWLARNARQIKLRRKFAYLDPSDIITVEYPSGSSGEKRIARMTDTGVVLECDVVDSDTAIYTQTAQGASPPQEQASVAYPYESRMVLLDMPILRDDDDNAGAYVAARNVLDAAWAGYVLFRDSGVEYEPITQSSVEAVMGTSTTALGDWTGPDVMDELSTVTVSVAHGELASSTRDTIINGTTNAMLIGDEVVQYVTATDNGGGSYTLTRFLRGRRGTEWAMTGHAAGERVVLLTTTALRRVPMDLKDVDVEMNYKPVTIGASLDGTDAEAFTNTAIGLKPFAPVHLRHIDEGGESVFTWDRRTRLSSNVLTGSIPLGEDTEAYDIEITDGDDNEVYSATVVEPRADVPALGTAYTLQVPAQYICEAGSAGVGCVDSYPSSSSGASLRVFDSADGSNLGGAFIGGQVTGVLAVGDIVYATMINGQDPSMLFRVDKDDLIASSTGISYTAPLDADLWGLAYDGTFIWVSESYSGQIRKLNATTLVSVSAHALAGAGPMTHDSGDLWIICGEELVQWDIGGAVEAQRFDIIRNGVDVLVIGSLVWVAGVSEIAVYRTSDGFRVSFTPGGAATLFRRSLVSDGASVYGCDPRAGQVIVFDAATGMETRRMDIEGAIGIAGVIDETVYVAVRTSGSNVQTRALSDEADLTGYVVRVYQLSAQVGRGYPVEITL